MSDRKNRLIFPYDLKEVFKATVMAIDDNARMKVNTKDESTGLIEASVGVSLFSWGHDFAIKVFERRDGNTEVKIIFSEMDAANKYEKNRKKINELMQDITFFLR